MVEGIESLRRVGDAVDVDTRILPVCTTMADFWNAKREVRAMLQQLRIVISFGLDGVPLACVGADGYELRLLVWMLCPLVLVSLATIAVLVSWCSRARRGGVLVLAQEQLLPIVLRIAFLVYPCACLPPLSPKARTFPRHDICCATSLPAVS